MKPNQLLWQLSTARRKDADEVLDDATLLAFRDGALGEADQARVEQHLGTSSASRARLAVLAGVVADTPPQTVRERILRQRDGTTAAGAQSEGGVASKAWRWQVAAAVLAVAVLLPLLAGDWRTGPSPAWVGNSAFDVSIEALAASRGEGDGQGARSASAYPDTRLTITVEALDEARDGLEYALFRKQGEGGLAPVGDGVEITRFRGAATLSGRAGTLLGPAPGTYELWVVVAQEGAMPDATTFTVDANKYLNSDRSRAYLLKMQLLSVREP